MNIKKGIQITDRLPDAVIINAVTAMTAIIKEIDLTLQVVMTIITGVEEDIAAVITGVIIDEITIAMKHPKNVSND